MAEDRDDLGHLGTGARATPAAATRQAAVADDHAAAPPDGPPRALTADAFPNPSIDPTAVLYQRADHGLALRWRLDPTVLAGARAAFAAEATPQLVLQVSRVGSGDAATRIPLDLGERADAAPAAGDSRFPIPTGNGAIEAEIGFLDERGGWMLVARSNRLDAIVPVGVPFLRDDRDGAPWPVRTDAPAAPVGAGWAATIAADAAARSGAEPATGLADGRATDRGSRPDTQAPTSTTGGTGTRRPGVAAARLPGPFPLWRPDAAASTARGDAAGETVLWPSLELALEPAFGAGARFGIAVVDGAPSGPAPASAMSARLPTRGLDLPLSGTAEAPQVAGTPFRLVAADAGAIPAPRSPPVAVVPVAGSGPVVRPGSSSDGSLRAELIIYGSAAPGSLIDLGDHRYRVGAGGRFMLRLPLADRALMLQVLAQLPDLPVLDRDADAPASEQSASEQSE